ncbi:MAG: low specificity L-threonine aldolase, partial [Actinobacteria bacterium]|nr:low specificity L-threonine aldolase [Actinomycetota bacterium]
MREAMRSADEESLPRLEALAASLLGKEAAVWTPTCSAANLVALLTLAEPGERVALEREVHILTTEGMGIASIAGLEPVSLDAGAGAAVVCLENTHTRAGGTVLSVEETARLAATAPRAHIDGARLPNAA